jgi:hypothetical protein
MKKHSMNLAILAIFALSTVFTIVPEEQMWQKIKNFAARNKGKIIGGGIAAVAAALGIGAAAYAKSKADIAIEKAEIRKDSPDYYNALLLLTTVGNLPQENAKKFILAYFDEDEIRDLIKRDIIKALAYYWDMSPVVLYGQLGFKLAIQELKQVAEEVTEAVHQGFNKLRGVLGFGPKEKPRK